MQDKIRCNHFIRDLNLNYLQMYVAICVIVIENVCTDLQSKQKSRECHFDIGESSKKYLFTNYFTDILNAGRKTKERTETNYFHNIEFFIPMCKVQRIFGQFLTWDNITEIDLDHRSDSRRDLPNLPSHAY